MLGIKITKNQNQKPIRGYLVLAHAQRHAEVTFNVHEEILNHWKVFLSGINNQLTAKHNCVMLEGICHAVPSSFGERAIVRPHISLIHFFYSSSLVITYPT